MDRLTEKCSMTDFLVSFDCDEHVIRSGPDAESVCFEDPLGCLPRRVRPLSEVELRGLPWRKDGELRVEVEGGRR